MTLLKWIGDHIVGWEIFLPAVLVLALAGTYLKRTSRATWVPYVVAGVWLATLVLVYHVSGIDRFWGYARRRWAIMVAVIILAGSIPLAAASTFLVARAPDRWRPRTLALCSAVAGIVTIPLTNVASGIFARILGPYLGSE